MKNVCPVCNYPIRKPNRTTHKSCEGNVVDAIVLDKPAPAVGPECCFCHSRDTRMINGAPFCYEHEPRDERTTVAERTLTQVPERCLKCNEPLTPAVTRGNIKCKCDQPKMPRHLRNSDSDDRPPMSVRYGN